MCRFSRSDRQHRGFAGGGAWPTCVKELENGPERQPADGLHFFVRQYDRTYCLTLRSGAPEVMKSFSELGLAAMADGALPKKTKELMALALKVAARCDPCIGYQLQTLVTLGATRQELD